MLGIIIPSAEESIGDTLAIQFGDGELTVICAEITYLGAYGNILSIEAYSPESGIRDSLIALCFLATGGGVGTFASTSSTSAEIRALRTEVIVKLEAISSKIDDHGRRLSNIEQWAREHEREPSHLRAAAELEEIKRRLKRLEDKN